MAECKKVCFHLILDLLAVLGPLLRKNGFSQASAVSLQLLLEESSVHIDVQYMAKSSSSFLSRTFNDCVADGIFLTAHHSLLQGMSSDKTFQNKGKCVSLGSLDHVAEEEDLLECAVGLAEEDNFSRQGLCSTTWLWENTGRSKQRALS